MRLLLAFLMSLTGPAFVFADEEKSIRYLEIVRTANEQHFAQCESGRMRFVLNAVAGDGKQINRREGVLEWNEDYQFFEGSYLRQWQGETKGTYQLNEDATLRFLMNKGQAVTRTEILGGDGNGVSVWLFPFSFLKTTPHVTILPDYRAYLNSRDSKMPGGNSVDLVQADAVTPKGVAFEREVSINGSVVTVSAYFQPGVRHIGKFDIEQGGLCIESTDEYEYMDPPQFSTTTRKLRQREDGVWYPAEAKSSRHVGSRNARPTGTSHLEISEFVPLNDRIMKGAAASISVFGPLPNGTRVTEVSADGRKRSYEFGSQETQSLESKLLEQAKSIRKKNSSSESRK